MKNCSKLGSNSNKWITGKMFWGFTFTDGYEWSNHQRNCFYGVTTCQTAPYQVWCDCNHPRKFGEVMKTANTPKFFVTHVVFNLSFQDICQLMASGCKVGMNLLFLISFKYTLFANTYVVSAESKLRTFAMGWWLSDGQITIKSNILLTAWQAI